VSQPNPPESQTCSYDCPICGQPCCTEPAGPSGLCVLHDKDTTPVDREAAARAAGRQSLADHLGAKTRRGEPLHGVDLSWAELDEASLTGADLRGSALNEARLRRAHLSQARLDGANLYNADLQNAWMLQVTLTGACLDWTNLRGVRGLRAEDCRPIRASVPGFRSVKRMFQEADDRDAASAFALREKRQQRRDLWRGRGQWFRSLHGLRRFGQWLTHCLLETICGYFENFFLPVVWSLAVILACGLAFSLGNGIEPAGRNPAAVSSSGETPVGEGGVVRIDEGIYFSAVTFTTLGYGDFRPRPGVWRLVAGAEAFVGAFLLSAFVVTLAHRYVVR